MSASIFALSARLLVSVLRAYSSRRVRVSRERGGAAFRAWKLKALVLNRFPTCSNNYSDVITIISVDALQLHAELGVCKGVESPYPEQIPNLQ